MAHCGCLQCGHRWLSQSPAGPRVCPACHSARWNLRGPPAVFGAGLGDLVRELQPGQSRLFPPAAGLTHELRRIIMAASLRAELHESAAGVRVTRRA